MVKQAYDALAQQRESLKVLSGPLTGLSCPITGALSIGRGPDSGLQLNDLQVSRKHAVIQQTALGTLLRDLGSGNGTFVGASASWNTALLTGM